MESVKNQKGWLNKSISLLDKVGTISRWANVIGIAVLFLMICVTFVDVILRYVFNRPLTGVVEITEVMMIVAIFFAVAHTHNEKGHVNIDLVTSKLSANGQLVMHIISTILGLVIFAIGLWRIWVYTGILIASHTVMSQTVQFPKAPFAVIVIFGCLLLCLLLLRDLLQYIAKGKEMGLKALHWILAISVPILIGAAAYYWMLPSLWHISLPTVALIGIVISLVFLLMGMPISFALILTSVVFIGHIRGIETAMQSFGLELYSATGSYTWSVLPFFILMGFICLYARFGEDLYLAAFKWFGHLKGGMAIATIGACTGFAAIVGDSVSATATMGAVALPEMRKYKYDDTLSTGCIVGGATLGPIIPPSTAFIIFGLLTKVSIGDLFIAGIIPGLVIAAVFMLVVYIWCKLAPNAGPGGIKSGWKARFISLKSCGSVLVLFILVVGGIYKGVFTPTEGGAIGGVIALLLGLIMKRFTWKTFIKTLQEGGKVVSMTFLILIGAFLFSRFIAWCNLTTWLTNLIMGAGLSPTMFMVFVVIALLILGCFIDLSPLLLIGVPVLYPISATLGINPIWFAVIVIVVINLGALTPPVGINLFVLKGMNNDIPIGTIYKGSFPFVVGSLVGIIIIFLIPSLSTWLVVALK
jgi:tripartite ATP-independent transporter DctM subunit